MNSGSGVEKVSLRRAEPRDLDRLLAIENAWPTTPHWSRKQFEEELASQRSHLWVIQWGDEIVGYADFWGIPPEAHLMTLAVDPGQTRRGFGRVLIETLLEKARALGCQRALLEVSAGNLAAISLYGAAGFHIVGSRPKYYNDGSDALLMDKNL